MADPVHVSEQQVPEQQVPGLQPTPEEAAQTFEQLMGELEAVTEALATGELGIEAAADLYARAERLHALASARLAQVQARVDALRTPR